VMKVLIFLSLAGCSSSLGVSNSSFIIHGRFRIGGTLIECRTMEESHHGFQNVLTDCSAPLERVKAIYNAVNVIDFSD